MKKKNFIFTKKKHPLIGIMSTILGVISVGSLTYAIIYSFVMNGTIPHRFGVASALALFYSLVGMVLGLYCFKLKDVFHLFAVIGIIFNGVALLVDAFLLWLPT